MNELKFFAILSLCIYARSVHGGCGSSGTTEKRLLQRLTNVYKDETLSTTIEVKGAKHTFKLRLCDNPAPSACPGPHNGSIIDETDCKVLGAFNAMELHGDATWIAVSYSDGSPCPAPSAFRRSSIITFICDPSQNQPAFQLVHISDECYYTFVVFSKSICPAAEPEGLSGGSVFCILFFTIAGTYFLFGVLYRRLVVRAKGIEQIPNYEVWRSLGNLIADGCDLVCRCGGRQESRMYQGIGGEPLGHEDIDSTEERDDRLLPM